MALSPSQAGNIPVIFDEHHLSEVQNTASEEKLDRVVDSMKESKVALIGEHLSLSLSRAGLTPQAVWDTGTIPCPHACPCPAGKIHTPMEYKGDLASYDMRLR